VKPKLSLAQLNASTESEFISLLDGIYEYSPWIYARAWHDRPYSTLTQVKTSLAHVVHNSTRDEQLGLIRAHPELAGKAMLAKSLTAESTNEQGKAGLTACTPQEFERIQQLNRDYNAKVSPSSLRYAAPTARA
jgi:beta-ureidopropionase / N-carbamoyl-L-amino-acid hydrolase